MGDSNFLLFFSFFLICFASSSSFNTTHKCSPKQALTLLLFKQNLSSINSVFGDPPYHSPCQDWLGSDYHPMMMNWNKNTDCCKWDGITCDHFTGDIIGIDLSCGMLQGRIHPNTTLFHLPHLQRLNLAYNDLYRSQLPHELGSFSKSLTHLNISRCGFIGEVSSEILFFPNLASLDLSQNRMHIQPYVLETLLQNSTHLRELLIANVRVDWILPTYLNISSSLKSLVLSDTGLKGRLPENIFNLRYLEILLLSNNDITGQLPEVNNNINIPLKWLSLSFTNLLGEIPNSIGHLKSLSYLSLSSCGLVGSLPKSLVNLTHLTTLDLSYNKINGTLSSFLFTLPLIEDILLDGNMLSGGLPSEFFNCLSLKKFSLGSNQFDGESNHGSTPFIQLINLTYLDLSSNKFIGLWDLDTLLSSLPKLEELYLSSSGLSLVADNSSSHDNSHFRYLGLASCKLTVFPEFLRAMKSLVSLDLSNNDIHGRIPNWAREIGGNELLYLNLSHNSISSLPLFQWDTLNFLYLQSNLIQGPFPQSICNMRNLRYLDMSNNRFDGVIPQCFAKIISSSMMINIGNNNFHGNIPHVDGDCGRINGLILNNNQIEGEVPDSLSKCQGLKVLDLGYNRLNATFPSWLGDFPKLQVLILRSNNLHGPIETFSIVEPQFPSLRVLDLSHNGFVGHLPGNYFQNFNAMKFLEKKSAKPKYMHIGSQYYSMIVQSKGVLREFPKILVDYVILDLSSNRFEGEIPSIIASLASLIVLDLSNNSFTSRIPYSLGNLSQIESLDLSWNQLTGEIPQSLTDLTFLGFLNLSQNHLVGRIPRGTQLSTFGTSFGGNPELCGLPLPKKCEHPHEPQHEVDEDTDGDGFTWRVVMLGYGCGTLLGFVIGYLMLLSGRPKWFNAIVDTIEHMMPTRGNMRRNVYIGK